MLTSNELEAYLSTNLHYDLQIKMLKCKSRSEIGLWNTLQVGNGGQGVRRRRLHRPALPLRDLRQGLQASRQLQATHVEPHEDGLGGGTAAAAVSAALSSRRHRGSSEPFVGKEETFTLGHSHFELVGGHGLYEGQRARSKSQV